LGIVLLQEGTDAYVRRCASSSETLHTMTFATLIPE
jgi:hypothetical protein